MLRLRDDLYWCDCDGRAVFLDTRLDRYFCLPGQANDAFLQLSRSPSAADAQHLQPLLSRGLMCETGHEGALQSPAQVQQPGRDWLEGPAGRVRPVAIMRAIASELSAARRLRMASLQHVLDRCRGLPVRAGPTESGLFRSIDRIAVAEASASFILRSHDRCLVRALAAHSLCKKAGAHSKLVFGVVAHPFSAHCWVQLGDAVIVGGYEQARLYTPILVVE